LETAILDPLRRELLAPERVARMAREMQHGYMERIHAAKARAAEAPKELIELESRIVRLRARLRSGDPDMASEEIEAAIARAEAKRTELMAVEPDPKENARLLAALPNAAELYRRQITLGLGGDPRATQKARLALRNLLRTMQLEQGDVRQRLGGLRDAPCSAHRGRRVRVSG